MENLMDSVVRRLFYMCIDLCEINGSFYYLFWMDEEHAVQLIFIVKGDTFVIKYRFLLFLKDRCTFTSLWHATLLISRADLYMKYKICELFSFLCDPRNIFLIDSHQRTSLWEQDQNDFHPLILCVSTPSTVKMGLL